MESVIRKSPNPCGLGEYYDPLFEKRGWGDLTNPDSMIFKYLRKGRLHKEGGIILGPLDFAASDGTRFFLEKQFVGRVDVGEGAGLDGVDVGAFA